MILLRWRCLITIEAAMPEQPDLNAPEFAPIKTRLARAYLDHKADLGVGSDQEIIDRVDDITAILFGLTCRAVRGDDYEWMARFGWFAEIVAALSEDRPERLAG
jgi:hypothetical protein